MAAKKTTAKKVAKKAPAKKTAAKKAPAKKTAAKKAPAKKAAAKKAPAKKAAAAKKEVITKEQFYSMVNEAAYFAAENDDNKKGATDYWMAANDAISARFIVK